MIDCSKAGLGFEVEERREDGKPAETSAEKRSSRRDDMSCTELYEMKFCI